MLIKTFANLTSTDLNKHHAHYKVCCYLTKLEQHQLRRLGGALGLSYSNLERMLMDDFLDKMVAAWLRQEDDVHCVPSWKTLVAALENIGQKGIACEIKDKEYKNIHGMVLYNQMYTLFYTVVTPYMKLII